MINLKKDNSNYLGFEQGPIRPPSEAASLLIRITRNCPWNRCTFCPVYKDATFELRPVEQVIKDIDKVHAHIENLQNTLSDTSKLTHSDIAPLSSSLDMDERMALSAAINWIRNGMQSVFLQDANSLIIKPKNLVTILSYLKEKFPGILRITSYARSHTISRISDENLALIQGAGLNRIHIGMESGSNTVLDMVQKGADKATHILAGQKVKRAAIELSEYVMPGLGGVGLAREHATETADALNQINPEFIRLRTLAIPNQVELYEKWTKGLFQKQSERMVVEEILLFLQSLEDITSTLTSDHILNLFEEVKGTFPEDKKQMISILTRFLSLSSREQVLYQVGRRAGIFSRLGDLSDTHGRARAQHYCDQLQITPENVDEAANKLMKRFI